ncbi:MAG: DNA polymerase III subunit delta' [Magnetococcales bacterium]|nr:DNA polymerase III subunit delta' [Magnetococcales bacterium]
MSDNAKKDDPLFDRIYGHGSVIKSLRQEVHGSRLAPGYLFSGPEGVGKSQIADALIQTLFCVDPIKDSHGIKGCGQCRACRNMVDDNHPDLTRLGVEKGKTRISVEQIRQLSFTLSLTAMEAAWKVAVIDDAALMTDAAANALLKTLEEPPKGTVIFLITANPGMMLPTIRSRCRKERFTTLSDAILSKILTEQTDNDHAVIQEAVALGQGRASVALAFCDSKLIDLKNRFENDMNTLSIGRIGHLCDTAAFWGKADNWPLARQLTKTWFQQTIRANMMEEKEFFNHTVLMDAAVWVEDLLKRAAVFHIPPRLVLEGVFLHIARLVGQ